MGQKLVSPDVSSDGPHWSADQLFYADGQYPGEERRDDFCDCFRGFGLSLVADFAVFYFLRNLYKPTNVLIITNIRTLNFPAEDSKTVELN